MPSIMMMPIKEEVEIVGVGEVEDHDHAGNAHRHRKHAMMMKGSISDLNWAAITMYTRIRARALAYMRPSNVSALLRILPGQAGC